MTFKEGEESLNNYKSLWRRTGSAEEFKGTLIDFAGSFFRDLFFRKLNRLETPIQGPMKMRVDEL